MANGRSPETALMIRLAGAGIAVYWYYEILQMYFKGGEDAPSVPLLILAGIVMVGGASAIGIGAYRLYKQEKARLEEAAAQAALSAEEADEEEEV